MRRNISVDELIKFLNPESNYVFYDDAHGFCINTQDVLDHLRAMPPADVQPEITLESAVDYLHSTGWMQEHDRTLLESAQFEPNCKGCKHQPRFSHEEPCCTRANNYENKYKR